MEPTKRGRRVLVILAVLTLCYLLSVVEAAKRKGTRAPTTPECFVTKGVKAAACRAKIRPCAQQGIVMKWAGPGCRNSKTKRPLGDGGCQCDHYCGYLCKKACNADPQCFWSLNTGTCWVKLSRQPGLPMPTCYNVTGMPTTSPTTSQPSTNPSKAPTHSPTPPTLNPTLSPTRTPTTKSPTTKSPIPPSVAPTTAKPTAKPPTSAPTTTLCQSCTIQQSCVLSACIGKGNLQVTMVQNRAGQMRLYVYPPLSNTYVGVKSENSGMPNTLSAFGQSDKNGEYGIGPNNIFWATSNTPPSGTYIVCAETWFMSPDVSPLAPVSVNVTVTRPSGVLTTLKKTFTQDSYYNPEALCRPVGTSIPTSYNYGAVVGTFTI